MKKKNIQAGAHASTLLAVFWLFPTLFGIFLWVDGHLRVGGVGSAVPLTIWAIQILLIAVAVYAWLREKPVPTLWLGADDTILDEIIRVPLDEIDLKMEKSNLIKTVVQQFGGLAPIALILGISAHASGKSLLTGSYGMIMLVFGLLAVGSILVAVTRYLIMWWRARKRVAMPNANHPTICK